MGARREEISVENPATWGPVEKVIHETIKRHRDNHLAGTVGLSRVRMIADALREAGLIKE